MQVGMGCTFLKIQISMTVAPLHLLWLSGGGQFFSAFGIPLVHDHNFAIKIVLNLIATYILTCQDKVALFHIIKP